MRVGAHDERHGAVEGMGVGHLLARRLAVEVGDDGLHGPAQPVLGQPLRRADVHHPPGAADAGEGESDPALAQGQRGVLRNPWILAQSADLAAGREARPITMRMRGDFLLLNGDTLFEPAIPARLL